MTGVSWPDRETAALEAEIVDGTSRGRAVHIYLTRAQQDELVGKICGARHVEALEAERQPYRWEWHDHTDADGNECEHSGKVCNTEDATHCPAGHEAALVGRYR